MGTCILGRNLWARGRRTKGVLWRRSPSINERFALRPHCFDLDERREEPRVRGGVPEVRRRAGDRHCLSQSVRVLPLIPYGIAFALFHFVYWCSGSKSQMRLSRPCFGVDGCEKQRTGCQSKQIRCVFLWDSVLGMGLTQDHGVLGYDQLTRAKSVHMKIKTST